MSVPPPPSFKAVIDSFAKLYAPTQYVSIASLQSPRQWQTSNEPGRQNGPEVILGRFEERLLRRMLDVPNRDFDWESLELGMRSNVRERFL